MSRIKSSDMDAHDILHEHLTHFHGKQHGACASLGTSRRALLTVIVEQAHKHGELEPVAGVILLVREGEKEGDIPRE